MNRQSIVIGLVLFTTSTLAKDNLQWKLFATAFVNHNNVFHEPTPVSLSNMISCGECSAYRSSPTLGFGGGFYMDKFFKNNLFFRTGIIYEEFSFIEKQSKEIAVFYKSSMEERKNHAVLSIPFEIGYQHHNLSADLGVMYHAIDIFNYFSIDYEGNLITQVSQRVSFDYEFIPDFSLMYLIPKFKTSIVAGTHFTFSKIYFYHLGIEFLLMKK